MIGTKPLQGLEPWTPDIRPALFQAIAGSLSYSGADLYTGIEPATGRFSFGCSAC